METTTAPHSGVSTVSHVAVQTVDTDVHPAPRSVDELMTYLPGEWRGQGSVLNAVGSPIYEAPGKAQRLDSYPPTGGAPASDPAFLEQQLFHDAGVDYAVLIPLTARPVPNAEHEAALCAATNAWLADTWLSRYNQDERYYGTIRMCSRIPELAVAEIERWAANPKFVQVMLNPYTMAPIGQQQYHPIYRAAEQHHLPIALHVNRSPGLYMLTPVGFASYFIEHHSLYPLLYATHLVSLITEGVFEKFPELKVVFVEGGFSWLGPILWRLDQNWAMLRKEVPWLSKRPSEYVAGHIWFTSQPVEEPPKVEDLKIALDLMDAEHILMFSTDYPHWDYDDPSNAFRFLKESARHRILCDNALSVYNLPTHRIAR